MEPPPKKKMPTVRSMLMLGVALFFSILMLVFSTLPISFPFIVGTAAGAVTSNYLGTTVGKWVGGAVAASTAAVEFFGGIDVGAIDDLGGVVTDAINLFAWMLFSLWFFISGIKMFGRKRAMRRFFSVMVSFICGLIPLINIIPTLLVGVSLIVWSTRKEDAENARAYAKRVRAQLAAENAARQEALQYYVARSKQLAVAQQRAIHDQAATLG